MASTNKTTNYELSQFQSSDIPAWLTDYNGDMQKIDAGIHAAKTQASGAASGVSALQTAVSGKQDRLTFDTAPLADSANPVTSGGIYNALQNVSVQTDAVPTQGSSKAVQSGGVYTALQGKQNTLTFDSTPMQGSSNPVTSGGVFAALQNSGLIVLNIKDPTSGVTVSRAKAVLLGDLLVLTVPSTGGHQIVKSQLSAIADTIFYAHELNYVIEGNPLGLTAYSSLNSAWISGLPAHAQFNIRFASDNNIVGGMRIALRYDGANTKVVEMVDSSVYNESWTSGWTVSSLLCAFYKG